MALDEYNKKRTFSKTPEPAGKKLKLRKESNTESAKPLHFVVQKHHASHLHYDFRLEMDGVLKSWAVPKGPSMDPSVKRLAMMVEDHPVSYMKFEGTIPQGNYGAGDVIVWDYGVYQSTETADPKENERKLKHALHKGALKFILLGEKLKGQFSLAKIGPRGDSSKNENSWILTKINDEYAVPESEEKITDETSSVLTHKTLPVDSEKNISKKGDSTFLKSVTTHSHSHLTKRNSVRKSKHSDLMPHDVKPMLATLTDKAFDRKGWIFEIKWDGYRAIAETGKTVKLYSRNSLPFENKYPTIVKALEKFKHTAVLDGEIVALDKNGKSNFHDLQFYEQKHVPLTYVIFDILYLDGEDLRNKPLIERKKILKAMLPEIPGILYGDYIEERGRDFFEQSTQLGLEGIMAKDAASTYRDGQRNTSWLKVKNEMTQEAIIVGFTEPRGTRKKLGSLVLAVHENGKYKYIGHSGGGFTERGLQEMYEKLLPLITENSPLEEKIPVNSPITWVKPKLVCEIKFSEWTVDGYMRHPIFIGLRTDKTEQEVVREKPKKLTTSLISKDPKEKQKLNLTHLDKVYWPDEGYTKGDVLSYYGQMADMILPYLKDRPESLNRHPNGINKPSFFQKNIEVELPPFIETKKIWSESNEAEINYLICNNKETLLYMANLGCIELNPWNSRTISLDKPDFMIIDLDPGNVTFEDLINVAQAMHRTLEMACEQSLIKTSGKRGLHIVVPLGAQYEYEQIKNFSHLLVSIVNKSLPDITSIERNPSKRKNKIYLDYLQNRRGQTLAAPYSLRPWKNATVSTPLYWDEVTKKLDPSNFTIKTIFKRLEKVGDLWKPVLTTKVDLQASIQCLEEHLKDLD